MTTSPTDSTQEPVKTGLILSNRLYDVLKELAQIWLPAAATLYFALSQIWGFPYGSEVVGTIAAVDAFLGVGLRLNSASYNKQITGA